MLFQKIQIFNNWRIFRIIEFLSIIQFKNRNHLTLDELLSIDGQGQFNLGRQLRSFVWLQKRQLIGLQTPTSRMVI